ncbi:MAG: asparagine--tRNA ligase [Polyangiaceae bacterium]
MNTPIITASDCEGAGQMFRVSTLDMVNLLKTVKARLTTRRTSSGKRPTLASGQLAVEAYCLALSKVYTFGPTFRAENSNTARHLAEFWMVEPEILRSPISRPTQIWPRTSSRYLPRRLERAAPDDMKFFADRIEKTAIDRLEKFVNSSFERIDYGEAIKMIESAKKKWEFPVKWGSDLQTEHERYLVEEKIGRPVVVMNYPEEIKAFYMRMNDDGKTVAAMDVLAPGIGEIIGGSQREERLDVLEARMDKLGLSKEAYSWYLDFRRYGTVPHAGFGLGMERLVVYTCGLGNIRDAIPYPRTPGNAEF